MKRALHLLAISGTTLAAVLMLAEAATGQPAGKVLVPAPPPPEAPLSLTASDGAGLELVSLSARAVIEDPLAFTELHLVFRNPEPRVREGRFRITLPEGATVSRFAMLIGSTWQEGEVVELQAARRAYEDFLHRRQDPALLETEAGNEFSARVFPIPAGASKELIISYSQELVQIGQPYRLPLRGLPKMQSLRIRAMVGKAQVGAAASSLGGKVARSEVVEVDKQDFAPDRDFEVAVPAPRLGLRHDNLVVTRIAPLGAAPPVDKLPVPASLLVLFDTSASRAMGFADQIARLQAVLGELGKRGDPQVTVAAFDQLLEPIFAGKASGFGEAAAKKLRERRALGASDLSRALGPALARVMTAQRYARVLLVTDGVATAGDTGGDKLRPLVKSLVQIGVQRLDVLAVGGIRDMALLTGLVTAGLPADGVVVDAAAPIAEQMRRLLSPTRSGLKVEMAGATWVWPDTLNGVQPGVQLLVYADLPAGKPLALRVGGRELVVGKAGLLAAERPLLERAWVKARIDRALARRDNLGAADEDLGEALRKQVIELSTRYRVLCPYTALLVLETESDYARFGIERRALADILTVGPEGIAVIARKELAIATAPAPVRERALQSKNDRSEGKDKKGRSAAPPANPFADGVERVSGELLNAIASDSAPASAPAAEPVPAMPAVVPPAPPARLESAKSVSAPRRRATSAAAAKPVAPARLADEAEADRPRPIIPRSPVEVPVAQAAPYEGELKQVMDLLARKETWQAMVMARKWRERDPGDVLALIALGEAAESSADTTLASRAYGSIIDLFPGRADLRRYAGERLERIRDGRALELAVDTYRKAAAQRPDHPASHRLLGMALLKQGRPEEAFAALEKGVEQQYPGGRFAGADRILREDLALAASAWLAAQPNRRAHVEQRLRGKTELAPDNRPSLRFVLVWETDANDVDFHIVDNQGEHAFFGNRQLASGGELYADVTTGYGPECFTIPLPAARRAYPYRLQAHYYSRGPMGYGMGKLQIIEHDGKGGLRFEDRPFLVMVDHAYVDMGVVSGPLGGQRQ